MKFQVVLNGTDENPWHRLGLRCNPFPQIARAEYTEPLLHLNKLGGDPIPDTGYIRSHLEGWAPEFVEACCARFKKGAIVKFEVTFPD
jgi:hypothetical protein